MSVKALGTSLKLTFEGTNQLIYPQTWFFMLVVITCVITQMNYLNKVSNTFLFNITLMEDYSESMFHDMVYWCLIIYYKDLLLKLICLLKFTFLYLKYEVFQLVFHTFF